MALFKKRKEERKDDLWEKCRSCQEVVLKRELERNLRVCPKCGYHFPISARRRLEITLDTGSFEEMDPHLSPTDPLKFKDTKRYVDRLREAQEKTGLKDAFVYGVGTIEGQPAVVGVFDFSFMGGSLGSVVGEKVTRAVEEAYRREWGLVIFSCSGGARMQEGILSLMQMAKTSAALARLKRKRLPYLSVLTDPTTGGVTASFGMLGDIIIAEPGALIGFAGPRVIKETIGEELPPGFQRSEYLLEHGLVDMVVERRHLKGVLAKLLDLLYH
ncbi:MAG: acetyl-CoA carboxylase carboxyl transferase subunit beta [Deltaproteobacteria bacterium]|nr:MAG: acetyl-CoA carboxylase carboxyl transferase subunit beta [Deltaproteobacteria bacterium]